MLLRFIDGTAWNSGQMLDNVNRTQLVLAFGQLIRHKNLFFKEIIALGKIGAHGIQICPMLQHFRNSNSHQK